MAQESSFFEHIKPHLGEAMVVFGALLLFAGYLLGWTKSNAFLALPILIILGGIGWYIKRLKD